jgi:hypothetical protein
LLWEHHWSYTITVSKEDALAASPEDYVAFLDEVVSTADANLFGLIFDDGTGVTYYGCDPINTVYGTIDNDGQSIDPYGFISPNDDGTYAFVAFTD